MSLCGWMAMVENTVLLFDKDPEKDAYVEVVAPNVEEGYSKAGT